MRIAVINETSAGDRNADILAALGGRGHEILNCGMRRGGEAPELSYIHTGFLAALLLDLGRVDLVVGGCGTGQGFLNSVLQYPGIVCGLLRSPLDAFLYSRINGGSCVSLALNEGYGWAADVNLRLIFDALFSAEPGSGYPEKRKEPQRVSRLLLADVSAASHRAMGDIVASMPDAAILPALGFPGVRDLVFSGPIEDKPLAAALEARYKA